MRTVPARGVRMLTLALLSAAVAAAGLTLWIGGGGHTPPVPWTVAVVLALAAGTVVITGWPVRRWVRQGERLAAGEVVDRKSLDPLVAARTLTFAVASAHAGAVLGGWYAGQCLAEFADVPGGRTGRLLLTGSAAAASLLLCVAGLVVQRWCRVPPDDTDGGASPAM